MPALWRLHSHYAATAHSPLFRCAGSSSRCGSGTCCHIGIVYRVITLSDLPFLFMRSRVLCVCLTCHSQDEGARAIAAALLDSTLRSLDLSHTAVAARCRGTCCGYQSQVRVCCRSLRRLFPVRVTKPVCSFSKHLCLSRCIQVRCSRWRCRAVLWAMRVPPQLPPRCPAATYTRCGSTTRVRERPVRVRWRRH